MSMCQTNWLIVLCSLTGTIQEEWLVDVRLLLWYYDIVRLLLWYFCRIGIFLITLWFEFRIEQRRGMVARSSHDKAWGDNCRREADIRDFPSLRHARYCYSCLGKMLFQSLQPMSSNYCWHSLFNIQIIRRNLFDSRTAWSILMKQFACLQKVGGAAVFGCVVLIGPFTDNIGVRAGMIMHRQTFRQKRQSCQDTAR